MLDNSFVQTSNLPISRRDAQWLAFTHYWLLTYTLA